LLTCTGGINDSTFPRRSPFHLGNRFKPTSAFFAVTKHSPEGADIFVRSGGSGPVVVLIHGYAENSDSWAPLATDVMKDHTVVVPDLRGIGRSSKPADGYDKKTQAKDIRAVVTS
jgi:pimeloyl-ACP methyl ester carboxylesterase